MWLEAWSLGGDWLAFQAMKPSDMAARPLLPFELGRQKLFIEAHWVAEIVGAVEVFEIPLASRPLPGVFLWNGHAIPLIDLESCLGLSPSSAAERGRTIIARVEGEVVGLRVDVVSEVTRVPQEDLLDVRVLPLRFTTAELDADGEVAAVVDLPGLVGHVLRVAQGMEL